ncbi:MAG: heparinase II/III family protein [Clostridia bacterium]|nr:heparinase II/III family protein [Clostridia bacterium]
MLNRAAEHIEQMLTSEFTPFPKWGDPAWQQLASEAREHLISQAEPLTDPEWPAIHATAFLEFHRNGNRSRYESVYFDRRDRLLQLVLAECAEGRGRFIDPIIDGLWAVCEETSWIIPAHNNHHTFKTNHALPDFTEDPPYIDLFSAETGSLLTWVYYFLSERLREESDLIPLRLEREIKCRILDPYLLYNDMHWLGLDHDNPVNNWNPWINSNVLTAFLIIERDPARRIEGLRKIARSAQRFLHFYQEDGGCDEGPNYFNVAGASMLDILELFYDATEGQLSLYNEPLIGNMADYIRHVHIAGPYFVNFADAPSRLSNIAAGCLLRTGEKTGNGQLMDFAREMYRDGLAGKPWHFHTGRIWTLFRRLKALFTYREDDFRPAGAAHSESHYFPGIQVPVARTEGGLFFAAKGGHNAESHNHNDVGNYILYAGGEPCVVDAGVGLYSKKTFSDQRYTIWSMQSGYHNTAVVNGCDQPDGPQHAAHSVSYEETDGLVRFSLSMEKAYASEAKLSRYSRRFELDRNRNTLTLRDSIRMEECGEPIRLPVMCYAEPVIGEGCVQINKLSLRFDPAQFTASCEEIGLDDPENPITCWNKNTLYRLMLTRTEKKTADEWTLTYSIDKPEG